MRHYPRGRARRPRRAGSMRGIMVGTGTVHGPGSPRMVRPTTSLDAQRYAQRLWMPLIIALFPLADYAGGRFSLSVLWAVLDDPLRGDWGLVSAIWIGDEGRAAWLRNPPLKSLNGNHSSRGYGFNARTERRDLSLRHLPGCATVDL